VRVANFFLGQSIGKQFRNNNKEERYSRVPRLVLKYIKEERYSRVPRLSTVTQLMGPKGNGDVQALNGTKGKWRYASRIS